MGWIFEIFLTIACNRQLKMKNINLMSRGLKKVRNDPKAKGPVII